MAKIIINRETFRDKVMGCWLGKNAGGTLGEPLEGKFGRDEMFDISWYTELPEGGIPNDDLELQLIWLQLLLKKGPYLKTEDFAEAWTDCIAYNFDEYGLSKANMQLGLMPPVCGWHNNYFKDCMGSPIRSEIWACLFPGSPREAAHYAFMDAIVDHGGGESVYGERFNTVLQSAAFVNDDKFELLELALASIPAECLTRRCVQRCVDNYKGGMSYTDNRNDLKDHFYNPVAQYSPLNLGFQTIGWLYGEDFGDSICKAVNCGWDTDCTAATLGALLGIIGGASSLPEKWIKPLGMEIATNMTSGGIRNLTAPTNIVELTDVVVQEAEKLAAFWGTDTVFSDTLEMSRDVSLLPPKSDELDSYSPNAVRYDLGSLKLSVEYADDASILSNRSSKVLIKFENDHPVEKEVKLRVILPDGFSASDKEVSLVIPPDTEKGYALAVTAAKEAIRQTNKVLLDISVSAEPSLPAIPVVFTGGNRWLISKAYENCTLDDDVGVSETAVYRSGPDGFSYFENTGNRLEYCDNIKTSGITYFLHHICSDSEKDVVLGVPNTGYMKLFLNGEEIHRTRTRTPLRPNLGNGGAAGDLSNYVVTKLRKGFNQILIKLESVDGQVDAHFTVGGMSSVCYKNHGMPVLGLERMLFSWEKT